jgi:hypothetical protein
LISLNISGNMVNSEQKTALSELLNRKKRLRTLQEKEDEYEFKYDNTPTFLEMAHEFERNLKKCNITLPLSFYIPSIPITEIKNAKDLAETQLYIDLHRNRKMGERLFLVAGKIISEDLGNEAAQDLQPRINNATDELWRERKSLSDQNQEELIRKIDYKLFQTVDKLLTDMLMDENLEISQLAQKLGMSIAKNAIQCFHQNILYLNHYLMMYSEYLFNTPFVFPKMIITNIGKRRGRLQFTSYAKGFSCNTIGTKPDGEAGFVDNGQLADVEIAVKFRLQRVPKDCSVQLMPMAYTSNINIAKTIYEIFCVKQLQKYQELNNESDELDSSRNTSLCHFFGSPQQTQEKQPIPICTFTLKSFFTLIYTEMALALPKSSNFSKHLEKIDLLPPVSESADKYLATLYLEKYKLTHDTVKNEEIKLPKNISAIAKATIEDLHTQFFELIRNSVQQSLDFFIFIPECILKIIYQYAGFISPSEWKKNPYPESEQKLTSANFLGRKSKVEATDREITSTIMQHLTDSLKR